MITQQQYDELWSLIKDIKVTMMTTKDGEAFRSRPMHIVQDEFKGTLWFFTSDDAHKVDEIENDARVNLSFADPDDDSFVSLSGTANLVKDEALYEEFWSPFVGAWFPRGKEDPNLALLEIHIDMAEYWDSKSNKMVQLYEIAKANLNEETPDLGENKKFA